MPKLYLPNKANIRCGCSMCREWKATVTPKAADEADHDRVMFVLLSGKMWCDSTQVIEITSKKKLVAFQALGA